MKIVLKVMETSEAGDFTLPLFLHLFGAGTTKE
jgi:hypothetical protein